jgi:diguanylate cyclase (GGDEF)-like protein
MIGYVLSLIGIALLAFAVYEIPRQLVENARAIARSERVIGTIEEIGRSALNAESTARAYVIASDAPTLDRYFSLLPQIDDQISAFRLLTQENRDQELRAVRLQEQINARFKFLTSVLRVREARGFEAAQRIATAGRGRASMNVIRATLEGMRTEEELAREALRTNEQHIRQRLTIVVGAMVLIGFLILTWITQQTRRALRLRRNSEEHVRHLAFHDTLTGLPNSRLLHDRLSQALATAKRHGEKLAVLYLDLDGFKNVNDTHGHAAGDELLKQAAARLNNAVRSEDTVARMGGDEFVLLLRYLNVTEDATLVAGRVIKTLRAPFPIAGGVHVSASIGVSFYSESCPTVDTLMSTADQALYEAKRSGKNRYQVHDHREPTRIPVI